MTENEAIRHLRYIRQCGEDEYTKDKNEAILMGIAALQAHKPLKVVKRDENYFCKICDSPLGHMRYRIAYCPACGQKINWGDPNER